MLVSLSRTGWLSLWCRLASRGQAIGAHSERDFLDTFQQPVASSEWRSPQHPRRAGGEANGSGGGERPACRSAVAQVQRMQDESSKEVKERVKAWHDEMQTLVKRLNDLRTTTKASGQHRGPGGGPPSHGVGEGDVGWLGCVAMLRLTVRLVDGGRAVCMPRTGNQSRCGAAPITLEAVHRCFRSRPPKQVQARMLPW